MVRMVGRVVGARQGPLGDGDEVGVAPGGRDDEQLGTGLAEGETHLPLAVEVDDRVLDGAEPGQRDGQDDGVDAGRAAARRRRSRWLMPRSWRPAATRSTRSRNWPQVTVSPSAAMSKGWSGDACARRSTSSHMVRAPVSISLVVMTPPSGTTLIAAGGAGPGRQSRERPSAWRRTSGGQNGCRGETPGALGGPIFEESDGGGKETVDRRHQFRLVGILALGILLGWFALANTRKVRIDFWVFHRQAPLIVVILISGLLGALITFLIMRRKPSPRSRGRAAPPGDGPADRRGGPGILGTTCGAHCKSVTAFPYPARGF